MTICTDPRTPTVSLIKENDKDLAQQLLQVVVVRDIKGIHSCSNLLRYLMDRRLSAAGEELLVAYGDQYELSGEEGDEELGSESGEGGSDAEGAEGEAQADQ